MTTSPTILTGIRVNSEMTLGNFLGALLPMARLANAHSTTSHINIFVPDLHSIIDQVDGELQDNLIKSLKFYLAAGLKPNQNIHFYRQSRVPAHSELCWILNCIASMGDLNRMTQYKDKSEGKESVNVGIFDYPVLMAADILLYDAVYIPVGEDQFQHIDQALRANPRTDSFLRYQEANYLIREQMPKFQFTDLWRILRKSHYVYNNDTIWSLALELTEQRFNVYYDTATGQKHTKFSF